MEATPLIHLYCTTLSVINLLVCIYYTFISIFLVICPHSIHFCILFSVYIILRQFLHVYHVIPLIFSPIYYILLLIYLTYRDIVDTIPLHSLELHTHILYIYTRKLLFRSYYITPYLTLITPIYIVILHNFNIMFCKIKFCLTFIAYKYYTHSYSSSS